MLYESQTSRTIVYDHRLIVGTMGIIFATVSQCYPSESGGQTRMTCLVLQRFVSAEESMKTKWWFGGLFGGWNRKCRRIDLKSFEKLGRSVCILIKLNSRFSAMDSLYQETNR